MMLYNFIMQLTGFLSVARTIGHRCQLSRYGRDTHDIKAPPDQRTPSMTVPTGLMTIAIDYAYYNNLWLCRLSKKKN